MHIDELVSKLRQLGTGNIPKSALKRWAFKAKVIPEPTRVEPVGRGRASDWSRTALEEAAAVWWVRHNFGFQVNNKMMKDIKRAAMTIYERPFAIYTLPQVTGPLLSSQIAPPEDIGVKFVGDEFHALGLFPGKNNKERSGLLNSMVVAWIAAVEKVREWEWAEMTARRTGSTKPVFCLWPMGRPACVSFFWWSKPSGNKDQHREYRMHPLPNHGFRRLLTESDRDQIVFYDNGIDTRKLFKIDLGEVDGRLEEVIRKEEYRILHSRGNAKLGAQMRLAFFKDFLGAT